MGDEQPRVALLGAGVWGRNHIRVWDELGHLATVCDPDEQQLSAVRERWPHLKTESDPDAVIRSPEIDAVVIASPAATHAELAIRSMESGKDVLVEKPMATKLADAEIMASVAREEGRILMIGHVLEYHPVSRELERLMKVGDLGKIRYLYSNRLNFGRLRTVESALWSFAPHDLSLLLRLVGLEPDGVGCDGGAYVSEGIPDVTLMRLEFPGNVRAHVFVSWLHPFREQRFVAVGDRQMAVFDDSAPWPEKLTLYPHEVEWLEGRVPMARKAERVSVPVPEEEPLRNECVHFVDCVQRRDPPLTGPDRGLQVLRILEAAELSLANGGALQTLERDEPNPGNFVHPTAVVEPGARIGPGTRVWHFTHVSNGAELGPGCILGQNVYIGRNVKVGAGVKIQNNVSVYEGVELGDHVFCGPSVVFTNVINPRSEIERKSELRRTLVGNGATLGANSTIVCGTSLGAYCFVGAGATVTHDVPAYGLVVGAPARVVGWVCRCGMKLGEVEEAVTCISCGRAYRRTEEHTIAEAD